MDRVAGKKTKMQDVTAGHVSVMTTAMVGAAQIAQGARRMRSVESRLRRYAEDERLDADFRDLAAAAIALIDDIPDTEPVERLASELRERT